VTRRIEKVERTVAEEVLGVILAKLKSSVERDLTDDFASRLVLVDCY
jgi:hypothetical protein